MLRLYIYTYDAIDYVGEMCNMKSKSQMRGVGRCIWVYGVVCEGIFKLVLLLLGDVRSLV